MVKEYIRVMPNSRINLVGFEDDTIKQDVTITTFEENPLEITAITSTLGDKIKYKLKTAKKGKEYVINVENRFKQAGSFSGKMVVETNSPRKPSIVLHVTGKVREKIVLRPTTFSFGTIHTTKEGFNTRVLKKGAVLKDVLGHGFRIKKIKPSCEWIDVDIDVQEENKQYAIYLTLDRDHLPKGQFNETINIYTSYKRKPMVVRVKGEVI